MVDPREVTAASNLILRRKLHEPTAKAWISPGGEFIPLNGLWHYQWALQNQDFHGVDLAGETEEQPVRLKMVAAGWWRVNLKFRPAQLTVEGLRSGINGMVTRAILGAISANHSQLNWVLIHVLDDRDGVEVLVLVVDGVDGDEVAAEVVNFFQSAATRDLSIFNL